MACARPADAPSPALRSRIAELLDAFRNGSPARYGATGPGARLRRAPRSRLLHCRERHAVHLITRRRQAGQRSSILWQAHLEPDTKQRRPSRKNKPRPKRRGLSVRVSAKKASTVARMVSWDQARAAFIRRRRAKAIRPKQAASRPGNPAPTMGPGTALTLIVALDDAGPVVTT